ncbi:hypothetical protein SAMN05877753_101336 [Bacillus oleivorans]|uniref:Uncharacterized protein n=1 Tax=Bacillus oleivorans TaxID=1448271 RepID=A0A285CHE6_9BACI|nr:hypothetical protein [Bacillus oleivorans]SNX67022.1 hypothetical protein SAMN05877753_101336 [Bacillus oleivorans]
MKNEDPFKEEKEISHHLDQFHVTVPDFPLQKNWIDRISAPFFEEAPNPLQTVSLTTTAVTLIQTIPVVVAMAVPVLLVWIL